MKKIFVLAIVATSFAACNDAEKTDTTITTTDTVVNVDATPSSDMVTAYNASEGDVMYTDGTTMVYTNGSWVKADKDVTIENGIVITKDGKVIKDDKTVNLAEGEVVNKSGNFFNRAGNAIENGWDATKHGVSEGVDGAKKGLQKAGEGIETGVEKAGEGIKKGANKVGEKTKEIFN